MRDINKVIVSDKIIEVEKKVVKETISKYTVDNQYKKIDVSISLIDENSDVLSIETYTFKEEKFVSSVNENQIWNLVDEERLRLG